VIASTVEKILMGQTMSKALPPEWRFEKWHEDDLPAYVGGSFAWGYMTRAEAQEIREILDSLPPLDMGVKDD
jgi:hypothetical protein